MSKARERDTAIPTSADELSDDELDQVAGGQMVAQMATQGVHQRDAFQATSPDRSPATPINLPFRTA